MATERTTPVDAERFDAEGFVVLGRCIDAAGLSAEVDGALARGFVGGRPRNESAEAGIAFRFLPMMSERTPISLDLLRRFRPEAERLLGRPVLPVRAKAVEYHGGSGWHRDSDLPVASLGFACYLEPLTAATGALRLVPGSHRDPDPSPDGAVAVETEPGDVIVFEEHTLHASSGGTRRRQWRVDYVARPVTEGERATVSAYFAGIFSPDFDGGYDVDAFPSYGPHWRRTCDPADDALLAAVGAYAAAGEEEAASRSGTRRRSGWREAGACEPPR